MFNTNGIIGILLFPEAAKSIGNDRRLDIRCSLSKAFLTGHLSQAHVTQVWLRDGNNVGIDTSFGCGIFHADANNAHIADYIDTDRVKW